MTQASNPVHKPDYSSHYFRSPKKGVVGTALAEAWWYADANGLQVYGRDWNGQTRVVQITKRQLKTLMQHMFGATP